VTTTPFQGYPARSCGLGIVCVGSTGARWISLRMPQRARQATFCHAVSDYDALPRLSNSRLGLDVVCVGNTGVSPSGAHCDHPWRSAGAVDSAPCSSTSLFRSGFRLGPPRSKPSGFGLLCGKFLPRSLRSLVFDGSESAWRRLGSKDSELDHHLPLPRDLVWKSCPLDQDLQDVAFGTGKFFLVASGL
jgi:hypothetical protein